MIKLLTYPRLGEAYTVSEDQIEVGFNVVVEYTGESAWDIELWHNFSDLYEWEALPFKQLELPLFSARPHALQPKVSQQKFTAVLKGRASRPVSFTIRYRDCLDPNGADWNWMHDQLGKEDGQLFYQLGSPRSTDFVDYIDCIDARLEIRNVQSETPNTNLWAITAPVAAADGNTSGFSHYVLGLPKDFRAWFALVRLRNPWLGPFHGRDVPLASKPGILYAFQRQDGYHLVVLAISGIEDILTVFQADQDKLVIEARNDRIEEGTAHIIAAVGKSFDEANCAVIYHARKIVATHTFADTDFQELEEKAMDLTSSGDHAETDWIQDWYDGLTYCTWNGLGQNLNNEKIQTALSSLDNNNINISGLIIDDNWQSLDNEGENQFFRGWLEFEANKKGFPHGIRHMVGNIRKRFPNIKHIAVWHALLGYWGGIAPDGKITRDYKSRRVAKKPGFGPTAFTVIDASDVQQMYNDAYSFLAEAGIDSVKTDAQFMLDEIDEAPARRDLTSKYLTAWNSAQLHHFGGRAISCMSQTPTNIFLSQLPKYLPKLPVRNSDDFFPDVEDSHPWHIFCNAHNALLAQHLNVLPDWDMFQTSHKWAYYHAAARCVSGGPIYITDVPGKHDVDLINQITAKTADGNTVILRPSCVGVSTQMYSAYSDPRLCCVNAYHGTANTGASVLAAFNCSMTSTITQLLHLNELRGTNNQDGYVLRSHRTGKVSNVLFPDKINSIFMIGLEAQGWELLSASPASITSIHGRSSGVRVADLGLIGKMTGPAAIISSDTVNEPGNRLKITTRLKALGVWGVWVEDLEEIDLTDIMVVMQQQPLPSECVRRSDRDNKVLEMDLEDAWCKMGLQPSWTNEISPSLYLRF